MSYCLNPNCQNPQNPNDTNICLNCGTKLLLGDRYRSLKAIGQGGFGRTFLAVDEYKPSKPRCVIKQFFPQVNQTVNNTEKAAELFQQEALRLDELGKHPQIPELLAYFTEDNRQYLVQEFIAGQNLAQLLEEEGTFLEREIIHLLESLLPVLQFIHEKQVIHRDIKPENIIHRRSPLVSSLSSATNNQDSNDSGNLVLVDLGAAKFSTGTSLEKTGTRIGDPRYIAPEQLAGRAIFASDIYSLGVTCIHLLTGIPALQLFDDGDAAWVWRDYLRSPVSDRLSRIIDKMLENATKRRYQSASDVLQDLHIETKNSLSLTSSKSLDFYQPLSLISTQSIPAWKCIYTITEHSQSINSLAFSPDGEILASGCAGNTIKLWHSHSGRLISTLTGHSKSVNALAFSPDGKFLASGCANNIINLWNLESGKLFRRLTGHSKPVNFLAFSPKGDTLASASSDNTIKLWELPSGWLIHTLTRHSKAVNSVAFSPDGQILASASSDKSIKLWNLRNFREIDTLEGHLNYVFSVAFSPDGQTLVSGSWDGTIKLWQVATGREIRNIGDLFSMLLTGIYCVAIGADGQILASGNTENTIKLWQTNTGKLINTLTGHSKGVSCITISPDGRAIASGSQDKTIKIWRFE